MDRNYCFDYCELGKQKAKEFLDQNNSACDAAMDMHWFVEKCKETCPLWKEKTK